MNHEKKIVRGKKKEKKVFLAPLNLQKYELAKKEFCSPKYDFYQHLQVQGDTVLGGCWFFHMTGKNLFKFTILFILVE